MKKLCSPVFLLFLLLFSPTHSWARDGFVLNFWQPHLSTSHLLTQIQQAAALGATHFSIPALFCQDTFRSTEVRWCNNTGLASPESLKDLGQNLTAQGFTISYLPLVLSNDGIWRGQFKPDSFSQWSRSYENLILDLTRIARQAHAQELILGSELNDLYLNDTFWRQLIRKVKTQLPESAVFVVANWDQVERVPFWNECSYIGLSSYFPLVSSQVRNPSRESLQNGWVRWQNLLISLARQTNKKLYFAELGYASVDTAASAPWDYSARSALNLELQALLFQVFDAVWSTNPWIGRIVVWSLNPSENPLQDRGFDIFGKPAERVLEELFSKSKTYNIL